MIEIVEANNDATLEELCVLLEEKVKVKISRATMWRITQKLKYTVKKSLYAAEKTNEKVQQKRVEYWEKIRDIGIEDLIFLDESGVNLAMLRLYARALKGKRARGANTKSGLKKLPSCESCRDVACNVSTGSNWHGFAKCLRCLS